MGYRDLGKDCQGVSTQWTMTRWLGGFLFSLIFSGTGNSGHGSRILLLR